MRKEFERRAEARFLPDQAAEAPLASDTDSEHEVRLICPRCGHEERLSRARYAEWTAGMRCGLCGPPHLLMQETVTKDE